MGRFYPGIAFCESKLEADELIDLMKEAGNYYYCLPYQNEDNQWVILVSQTCYDSSQRYGEIPREEFY